MPGVRSQDRAAIARAITWVESNHPGHRIAARGLLSALAADSDARPDVTRVGISDVPGVGKSTFIERLGTHLTSTGIRVGVLIVDCCHPFETGHRRRRVSGLIKPVSGSALTLTGW